MRIAVNVIASRIGVLITTTEMINAAIHNHRTPAARTPAQHAVMPIADQIVATHRLVDPMIDDVTRNHRKADVTTPARHVEMPIADQIVATHRLVDPMIYGVTPSHRKAHVTTPARRAVMPIGDQIATARRLVDLMIDDANSNRRKVDATTPARRAAIPIAGQMIDVAFSRPAMNVLHSGRHNMAQAVTAADSFLRTVAVDSLRLIATVMTVDTATFVRRSVDRAMIVAT